MRLQKRKTQEVGIMSNFSPLFQRSITKSLKMDVTEETLQQFNKNFQNSRQIDIGCQYNEAKDSSI